MRERFKYENIVLVESSYEMVFRVQAQNSVQMQKQRNSTKTKKHHKKKYERGQESAVQRNSTKKT